MTFLFVLVNSIKLIVLMLFLVINWYDEGSLGWAFQHAFFVMIFLFIFLPLSIFEKARLRSRSVPPLVTYIPLFMALFNWIPIFLGNWSTKALIVTQLISAVLTVFVVVVFFRPAVGRAS